MRAVRPDDPIAASTDPADAKELLGMIDQIDEAWHLTGGPATTRVSGRPS